MISHNLSIEKEQIVAELAKKELAAKSFEKQSLSFTLAQNVRGFLV